MVNHWYYTSHALLLVLAALVSVALVLLGWRHRDERGGLAFTVLMLAAALWAGSAAIQVASFSLQAKLLWRVVGFAGHNLVPVALVAFAVTYAGESAALSRRRLALLAAVPLTVAVLVAPSNALGYHHLLWSDFGVVDAGGTGLLVRSFGPLYWLVTAYNYGLVLVAVALLVRMAAEGRGVARKQGVALLAGVVPPFVANILWVADATTLDYTPVAFTVSGVLFALALVRYRLFDLPPVARDTVLARMRDGYLLLDERNRVVDLNATARQLSSLDGRVVGHTVHEAFPEYVDVFLHGGDDRSEVTVESDDDVRYFEVSVSPLSLPKASRRLVLLHDVTERRSVERRYRSFIESATDMVTVLAEDGTLTYVSPAGKRILGYDPDALVGRDAFALVHPADRDRVRASFQRALEDESYEPAVEYRFQRADGTWAWLESRGRNLLSDPDVEGFVVNSREITARKRRERALREQNERLDEFASIVSHDLRNPLNVVQGHLELARETDDVDEHLDAIEQASARMESLVDGLLTLARQGRVVGETEDVSLAAVAESAWDLVATEAATLEFEGDLGVVDADHDRLCELFENLFRNAVEHGSTGNPNAVRSDDAVGHGSTDGDASAASDSDASVTVRVGPLTGGFYVEDDGPGIPDGERDAVFEHGYTTADDGTGLGLAIVRSIASAHGWRVDATEAESGGARFEFSDTGRRVAAEAESEAEADGSPRPDETGTGTD